MYRDGNNGVSKYEENSERVFWEMMIQRTSGIFEGEQEVEDRKQESTSKGLTWK